ncbi:MAG: hypothetical protein F6K42_03530 [Leptolyngbya sp. SIO1D8]|nr:hypothetical protein [Leptolyngbya sp. SIO1D8]
MAIELDVEGSSADPESSLHWLMALWRRLTLRLVLLLGVLVFLVVVSIDSLHQASAADMGIVSLQTATASPTDKSAQMDKKAKSRMAERPSYLEFDAEIAERLRHSDLIGASLTRSRLAGAHLLTQRVR